MNGIRTYFRRWHDSGFRQSYECLYKLLDEFNFYLFHGDCIFHFPWEDDSFALRFEESAISHDDKGKLYSANTLTANDIFVSDDWNGITLTDSIDIAQNRRVYEALHSLRPTKLDFNGRIIYFHNYDGAFWQFFTNDPSFVNEMIARQTQNTELDLRLVDYQHDYPDPGRYRDDYPPKAEPSDAPQPRNEAF